MRAAATTALLLVCMWARWAAAGVSLAYRGEHLSVVGITADASGHVFFAATAQQGYPYSDFLVASVTQATDAVRWVTGIPSDAGGFGAGASNLTVDANGDVIAIGYTDYIEDQGGHQAAVVKLDGATGARRWRAALGYGIARAVAIDSLANVVVSVWGGGAQRIIKLAGSTGLPLWETAELGTYPVTTVSIDGHGDVVLSSQQFIAKQSGSDGQQMWRVDLSGALRQHILTSDDDVVSTEEGPTPVPEESALYAVRRSGAGGVERWRTAVSTFLPEDSSFISTRLALDSTGRVIVATTNIHYDRPRAYVDERGIAVASLDPTAGAIRWSRALAGDTGGGKLSNLLANGEDIVVWWQENRVDHTTTGHLTAVDAAGAVRWWRRIPLELGSGAVGMMRDGSTAVIHEGASDTEHFVTIEARSARTGGRLPCGNGLRDLGETCDDGNPIDGDGCDHDCSASACGNGIIAPPETCDDGNARDSDHCSATCALEATCGPIDFRGTWSLDVTCDLPGILLPTTLRYQQNIVLDQDCDSGLITARETLACDVMLPLFPQTTFSCASTPSPLTGVGIEHHFQMPANSTFSTTLTMTAPVTIAGCTFTTIASEGVLTGRVAEDPPGRAILVRGILNGTYHLDGACTAPAATPCRFDLTRIADPVLPSPPPDPPVHPYLAALRAALSQLTTTNSTSCTQSRRARAVRVRFADRITPLLTAPSPQHELERTLRKLRHVARARPCLRELLRGVATSIRQALATVSPPATTP